MTMIRYRAGDTGIYVDPLPADLLELVPPDVATANDGFASEVASTTTGAAVSDAAYGLRWALRTNRAPILAAINAQLDANRSAIEEALDLDALIAARARLESLAARVTAVTDDTLWRKIEIPSETDDELADTIADEINAVINTLRGRLGNA